MTLDQIRQSRQTFLTAADIAPVLACDAQVLRVQARENPRLLGFDVCVIGSRCRFVRESFLRFVDGKNGGDHGSSK